MKIRNVKVGKRQVALLDALAQHGSWSWSSGWVWTTRLATKRMLERLVEMGLVSRDEHGVYRRV